METIRILLVGRRSGLWEILEYLAAKSPDLVIVGRLDNGFNSLAVEAAHATLAAAVERHDANVLILDGGGSESRDHGPGTSLRRFGSDLAQMMLELLPNVILVLITALGRFVVVHSALHVDNIGIDAFVDTIRAALRSATRPLSD